MKYFIIFLLFPFFLCAQTKIAIIGDSISEGYGVADGQSYVDLLRSRYLAEGKDITIINRSYKGATTSTGEIIIVDLLTQEKPDYLVIFLGLNDAGANVPYQKLLDNFISMVSKAKPNVKRVIIGGVDTSTVNPGYLVNITNAYIYLINNFNVYPVLLLNSNVLATASDKMHPSAEGHKTIATTLYQALEASGVK